MIQILFNLILIFTTKPTLATEYQTFKDQIEAAITKELSVKEVYVIFNNNQKIGKKAQLPIKDLYINYDNRTFELVIDNKSQSKISGKFDETVYIPVLNNNFNKGHVLEKDDLMFKKAPKSIIKKNMISNENELIGCILSKPLKQGAAIFTRDIQNNKSAHLTAKFKVN